MSSWNRKHQPDDSVTISQEAQRYIRHLQFQSEEEHNEDDDVTHELLTRLTLDGDIKLPPKEIREARQVIKHWLKIENEAKYIRCHGVHNNNDHKIRQKPRTQPTAIVSKQQSIKPAPAPRTSISRTSSQPQLQSSSRTTFDAKFAKLKSRALHRAKQQKFEQYKTALLSSHRESRRKTKQMVEAAMSECKDEETPNFDDNASVVCNAEVVSAEPSSDLKSASDLKEQKRLSTKKVLQFQLQEIEKQEKYHDKKLLAQIVSAWHSHTIDSREMEHKALNLHRVRALTKLLTAWSQYTFEAKQTMRLVFSAWLQQRLASQNNEIKAVEFLQCQSQTQWFVLWSEFTKKCIEARRMREMQLQTRLFKMEKLARRHYHYVVGCKTVKAWKEYSNDQQTRRFLEQQRNERKLKVQQIVAAAHKQQNREKPSSSEPCATAKECASVEQHTSTSTHDAAAVQACRPTQKMSQSIQTETAPTPNATANENGDQRVTIDTKQGRKTKESKPKQAVAMKHERTNEKVIEPNKSCQLQIAMEKRALERRQKREQLLLIKKAREEQYQQYLEKQKAMQNEQLQLQKRMRKEEKLKQWQEQQRIKEIESKKLKLSKLHFERALLVYYAWIPWMQCVERTNFNYHRLAVLHHQHLQRTSWHAWQSVRRRRKLHRMNAEYAATAGRQHICDRLFVIKMEQTYWSLWKELILNYKMIHAMIVEKRKLSLLQIGLKKWHKQYELQLTKYAIQATQNEEIADKQHLTWMKKKIIRSWKVHTTLCKKEKLKARTWRKVEVWLAEMRANR